MENISPLLFGTPNYTKFDIDKSVTKAYADAVKANAEIGYTTGINLFTFGCNRDSRTNLNPLTNLQYRQMIERGDFEEATNRFEIIA